MKQPVGSLSVSDEALAELPRTVERNVSGARNIVFASHVGIAHRSSLELLVYFNSGQNRVADSIMDAIEQFGPPEIVVDGDRLRLRVTGLPEAQSLFALDGQSGRPLGVAVYSRPQLEHMIVVHLGIAAEFASGGIRASEQLLLKLLRELRRCSRRIKGVQRFELFYLSKRTRNGLRRDAGARI